MSSLELIFGPLTEFLATVYSHSQIIAKGKSSKEKCNVFLERWNLKNSLTFLRGVDKRKFYSDLFLFLWRFFDFLLSDRTYYFCLSKWYRLLHLWLAFIISNYLFIVYINIWSNRLKLVWVHPSPSARETNFRIVWIFHIQKHIKAQ